MNQQGTSLNQIAKQYDISTQTLRRRIEQHPELGIKLVARKRTVLDANQTAALCAILDKLYTTEENAPAIPSATPTAGAGATPTRSTQTASRGTAGSKARSTKQPSASSAAPSEDLSNALNRIAELEKANAELLSEKQRLETDIAVANARAEERGDRISSLERHADEYPKLLKEGKSEARAAGIVEGKAQGIEEGRKAGIEEERTRWQQMGRWKRFFGRH